ncbi:hypothetical protein TRAPUB_6670 [Trametes pubescens]|uniref:Uncharacterized protein n=1 Tax=Trametes pubescens TaxID=154538 RepID=A0A1M2V5H6_TRAPU|nr:hypothetical protein TRAPUB_6670 [Trametes pubescens]
MRENTKRARKAGISRDTSAAENTVSWASHAGILRTVPQVLDGVDGRCLQPGPSENAPASGDVLEE